MWLIDARGSYTINSNDYTGYSLAFGGGIISVADEWGHIVAEFDADDAPTIDAVPVVRCRECKNQHTFDCPMNYEAESFNEDDGYDSYMATNACNDDGFCWLGERKDGDTDG